MIKEHPVQAIPFEHRWSAVLTILIVICLLVVLPGRIRVFSPDVIFAAACVLLVPMILVELPSTRLLWLRIEHVTTLFFAVLVILVTLISLSYLVLEMVRPWSGLSGLQLLTSAVGVWATNVLAFSLIYWRIDRGGPEVRVSKALVRPDWLFPQDTAANKVVQFGWTPKFLDYLYLAYSTATAFSTTDVIPLSARAKGLMMFESAISLVTILMVAARAINILG